MLIISCEDKGGKKTLQFVREKKDFISRYIKLCGDFCIITSEKMIAEVGKRISSRIIPNE